MFRSAYRFDCCALTALFAAVLRTPTLLAPERLLERKEHVSPPRFIGEELLPAIVESIRGTLADGGDRKPPFAVIRSTRSGKTRLLQEIANRLRENGVVAIFTSFNGNETPLVKREHGDIGSALLRRISFALAEEKLSWPECGAADVERFLAACRRPVVLLVDEINAVFKPKGEQALAGDDELWRWLKSHFLVANRQLVFSSHANDTYEQVSRDFVATDSSRPVTVLQPPLIDEPLAAVKLFPEELGVTTEAIALAGRIPGQIFGRDVVDTKLGQIKDVFDPSVFATACLSSTERFELLPRAVRQVGLFELVDRQGSLRWTPYCITALLRTQVPFLWETAKAMAVARSNSGEIWEFLVALAITASREALTCAWRRRALGHRSIAWCGVTRQ